MKIRAVTSKRIIQDQWTKLVWNSAFNPLSTLYIAKLGDLCANAQAEKEAIGIMNETTQIAHAKNIMIHPETPQRHWEMTKQKEWANFRTSMLQDFESGKALEIDELLGYIIEEGENLNIATPYASEIYKRIKAL